MSATMSESDIEKNNIIKEIATAIKGAFPDLEFIINKTGMREFAKISWKEGPTVNDMKVAIEECFGIFVTFNRILDESNANTIIDEFDDRFGTADLFKAKEVTVRSDDGTKEITGFSFTFGNRVFTPRNEASVIEHDRRSHWIIWNFNNRKFS